MKPDAAWTDVKRLEFTEEELVLLARLTSPASDLPKSLRNRFEDARSQCPNERSIVGGLVLQCQQKMGHPGRCSVVAVDLHGQDYTMTWRKE